MAATKSPLQGTGGDASSGGGVQVTGAGKHAPTPFKIGPIDGWTTAWHIAPEATAIPLGTVLSFRQDKDASLGSGVEVRWRGAEVASADDASSLAHCTLESVGPHEVEARVLDDEGVLLGATTCVFEVVDVGFEEVFVELLEPWVVEYPLGESTTNEETVVYFKAHDSLSPLIATGEGYRTTTHREVHARAVTFPSGFEPLLEWRADGLPAGLGAGTSYSWGVPGAHVLSVGQGGAGFSVFTFDVEIVAPSGAPESLPWGVPITFEAQTDPPGFQDELVWFASTLFGSAEPWVGEGRTFTTTFEGVWGKPEVGAVKSWYGVRSGGAKMGIDQPLPDGACCLPDSSCIQTNFSTCMAMGGVWAGFNEDCAVVDCVLTCEPKSDVPPAADIYALDLSPIEGFTREWGGAPLRARFPLGATAQLRLTAFGRGEVVPLAPFRLGVSYWNGAVEIDRSATESTAEVRFDELGPHTIEVAVEEPAGLRIVHRLEYEVVDVQAAEIEYRITSVDAQEFGVDGARLFGLGSLDPVEEIAPRHYLTSTGRRTLLSVTSTPPGFEPLAQWWLDGAPLSARGASAAVVAVEPGDHVVAVGNEFSSDAVDLTTYAVRIVGSFAGPGSSARLPEGEVVTLAAVTDPPGYEHRVAWLAATKYGRAVPERGVGPVFAFRLEDSIGPEGLRVANVRAGGAVLDPDSELDGWGSCLACACCGAVAVSCGVGCAGLGPLFLPCFTECLAQAGAVIGVFCINQCIECYETVF